MSEPTSASGWTGTPEEMAGFSRRHIFTHRIGEPGFTSDYAHIAEAQRLASLIPPEVVGVIRLAGFLLISPALLWAGWGFLGFASRDMIAADRSEVLLEWGSGVILLAVWQMASCSLRLIWLRKTVLRLALFGTIVLPVGYVYFGLQSQAHARASAAERTYEWSRTSGRAPFRKVDTFHQRADGTTLEGTNAGPPLDYGRACALVQRLDGPHGFSWIRVLDRSRAPARGQLAWPIRREECFSDTPLSTLPR